MQRTPLHAVGTQRPDTARRTRPSLHDADQVAFGVRRQRIGEAVRVHVDGELDAATAPVLTRELAQAAADGTPVVVADLTGVTLLDSTALLALLRSALALRVQGGELVVRPPEGPGRRLFDLVRLERPLTVLPDFHGDTTQPPQHLGSLVTSLLDANAQLEHALSSRVVIEQAKGILAERLGLGLDAAFALMRRTARSRRQRVHDLATAIVEGTEDAEQLLTRAS